MLLDPDSSRTPRSMEVLHRLYPQSEVDYRSSYVPGEDWSGFDVVYMGEYSGLAAAIRDGPPTKLPPKTLIYGSQNRLTVFREIRKHFPDYSFSLMDYRYLRGLLHNEGETDFLGELLG